MATRSEVIVRKLRPEAWDSLPRALQIMASSEFSQDALQLQLLAQDVLERIKVIFYDARKGKRRYEIVGGDANARIQLKTPSPKGKGIEKGFRVIQTNLKKTGRNALIQRSPQGRLQQRPDITPTAQRFGFTIQHSQANNERTAKLLRVLDQGRARDSLIRPIEKTALRYITFRNGRPMIGFSRGSLTIPKDSQTPIYWMEQARDYLETQADKRVLDGAEYYATFFNNAMNRPDFGSVSKFRIDSLARVRRQQLRTFSETARIKPEVIR